MSHIDDLIMKHSPVKLYFYRRFVDDTFMVMRCVNDVERFNNWLNTIDANIKFTYELEVNNQLSFLDVKVTRSDNNQFTTRVNIKSTDTGLLPNFKALMPMVYKRSAILYLINRTWTHTSNYLLFNDEINTLRKRVIANGYSSDFFDNLVKLYLIKKFCNNSSVSNSNTDGNLAESNLNTNNRNDTDRDDEVDNNNEKDKTTPKPPMIFINWRGHHTSQFGRKLHKLGFRVIYTTVKLKQLVTSSYRNTTRNNSTACHCIYKYVCKVCGADYIGSTMRHLLTRTKEHHSDILHNHDTCNQPHFNNSFSILENYIPSYFKLLVTEDNYIRIFKPKLNTMHTSNRTYKHTLKIL